MFRNTVLILILALAASQVSGNRKLVQQAEIDRIIQREIEARNIIDDAKELLQKLKQKVEDAVHAAVDKLEEIVDEIKDLATDAIDKGKEKIEEVYGDVIGALEDIKEEAEAAGIDIKVCLEQNEDKIKQLPKDIFNELLSCITDKIDEAVGLVTDSIDDVKDAVNDVKALTKELDDCGSGWSSVLCVTKVVAKITLAIVEVPAKIAINVAHGAELVLTLKGSLKDCAILKAADLSAEGMELVVEISECVRQLP